MDKIREPIETKIIFYPMIDGIHGTVMKDGEMYLIVINSNESQEEQRQALRHELDHIFYRDFDKNLSVDEIERQAHERDL